MQGWQIKKEKEKEGAKKTIRMSNKEYPPFFQRNFSSELSVFSDQLSLHQGSLSPRNQEKILKPLNLNRCS